MLTNILIVIFLKKNIKKTHLFTLKNIKYGINRFTKIYDTQFKNGRN
jgi:hypothetical protein